MRVHGALDRADRYKGQLDNLLGTLCLVKDTKELQVPAVEKQIEAVVEIGKELKDNLDVVDARLAKGKTKQYMHAFASGDRDEKGLSDILARLDGAKADLTARILIAYVGLSSAMRADFAAALPTVERVDQNVQQVRSAQLEAGQADENSRFSRSQFLVAKANGGRHR